MHLDAFCYTSLKLAEIREAIVLLRNIWLWIEIISKKEKKNCKSTYTKNKITKESISILVHLSVRSSSKKTERLGIEANPENSLKIAFWLCNPQVPNIPPPPPKNPFSQPLKCGKKKKDKNMQQLSHGGKTQ